MYFWGYQARAGLDVRHGADERLLALPGGWFETESIMLTLIDKSGERPICDECRKPVRVSACKLVKILKLAAKTSTFWLCDGCWTRVREESGFDRTQEARKSVS